MSKPFFDETKKYTFSDYFDLNHSTEEIALALGYSFDVKFLELPLAKEIDAQRISDWQREFYDIIPKITFNSEMAKREFMIAPVLWEVLRHVKAKISIEYPIQVDDRLGGSLDYLIRSEQELIVIEAKKGDLDKGFNQLTAEMIALDKFDESKNSEVIYGAISIGELWRFGILDRQAGEICKDLHTYRVPEDIETVFLTILGVLQKN